LINDAQKEKNGELLVEKAASALGAVFFTDSGEGRDIETDEVYLMDMSGRLIPLDRIGDFESSPSIHDKIWAEFFCFAEWRLDGDDIKIDFKQHPIYHDEP